MNKPNIIITPSGDRMVLIPLRSMSAWSKPPRTRPTRATLTRSGAALRLARRELIPAEVVGPNDRRRNKVRVWREYRGMPAKELAEATGLAAPYISQLETVKREGDHRDVQEDRRRTPRRYRRYRLAARKRARGMSPLVRQYLGKATHLHDVAPRILELRDHWPIY